MGQLEPDCLSILPPHDQSSVLEPLSRYKESSYSGQSQAASDEPCTKVRESFTISEGHQTPTNTRKHMKNDIEPPNSRLNIWFGYCIAPEFPKAVMELGDIVSDLGCQNCSLLLRLSTIDLLPEKRRSYQNLEFTTLNHQSYDGPLSSFWLKHTITRTSYTIQSLQITEVFPNPEFYIENQERIVRALRSVSKKKIFLVYGVATAGTVKINRSTSERQGVRFGFSTRLGSVHLGDSADRDATSKNTLNDSVVGYGVLSLGLKNGKIMPEKFVTSESF